MCKWLTTVLLVIGLAAAPRAASAADVIDKISPQALATLLTKAKRPAELKSTDQGLKFIQLSLFDKQVTAFIQMSDGCNKEPSCNVFVYYFTLKTDPKYTLEFLNTANTQLPFGRVFINGDLLYLRLPVDLYGGVTTASVQGSVEDFEADIRVLSTLLTALK